MEIGCAECTPNLIRSHDDGLAAELYTVPLLYRGVESIHVHVQDRPAHFELTIDDWRLTMERPWQGSPKELCMAVPRGMAVPAMMRLLVNFTPTGRTCRASLLAPTPPRVRRPCRMHGHRP